MDAQAVQRFQRVRTVQMQLAFQLTRRVRAGRLLERAHAGATRESTAQRQARTVERRKRDGE